MGKRKATKRAAAVPAKPAPEVEAKPPADPLVGLRRVARRRAELDALEGELVAAARAAGASWDRIGRALGRTGVGVRKRHGAQDSQGA